MGAAALGSAPAPAATLSDVARKDVQCFVLYAVAVQQADEAKDDKVREAGSLGLMYLFGRLQVEAPGADLAAAVRQEAQAIDAGEDMKDLGAACDAEFQKRGAELMDLGKQLQESVAPSPAT
jgi:hypothetical protein